MRVYWLDTGFLVQNRRRLHPKVRVPKFWEWVEAQIEAGRFQMPERVYAEVIKGDDWLVRWARARRDKGLCIYPDGETQKQYTIIADYVESGGKYKDGHQKDRSLSGADLWVIAHAKANKSHFVVSQEDKEKVGDNRVKVPSVCDHFGVTCFDTYRLLEKLNARF